ncbi:MAG: tRNA (adenosine(37)-N6)-dimethylallyltransferase MiaA [Bacteroides sp.]|nr:tRNA (adenosine(37)-N6)-dimethylallyltransferase MiaA [Bacteroides sp.]MCM1471844.1 tRNA (adenosine(37)-N6)-dimethylallyltransferase MiaA [Bacteroides sp.]
MAIELAEQLHCEILSADSRQIYRGIPITTAAPSPEELTRVKHHFIATLPLDAYYSAAVYEEQALATLNSLFASSDYAIMCGGSMMYIDAVTRGIDNLPTISDEIRTYATNLYLTEGIDRLRHEVERIDPDYYVHADINNHKRLIHALEISLQAGVPYSSLRTGQITQRPFRIIRFAISMPRPMLFDRINRRVLQMVDNGMIEEARSVYHLRHLNSLNTVGFKEMFAHFDGLMDLPTAIARIQKNTRVYAKKQLTWLQRRPDTIPLPPNPTPQDILVQSDL